jgi:hypothetical protein
MTFAILLLLMSPLFGVLEGVLYHHRKKNKNPRCNTSEPRNVEKVHVWSGMLNLKKNKLNRIIKFILKSIFFLLII